MHTLSNALAEVGEVAVPSRDRSTNFSLVTTLWRNKDGRRLQNPIHQNYVETLQITSLTLLNPLLFLIAIICLTAFPDFRSTINVKARWPTLFPPYQLASTDIMETLTRHSGASSWFCCSVWCGASGCLAKLARAASSRFFCIVGRFFLLGGITARILDGARGVAQMIAWPKKLCYSMQR